MGCGAISEIGSDEKTTFFGCLYFREIESLFVQCSFFQSIPLPLFQTYLRVPIERFSFPCLVRSYTRSFFPPFSMATSSTNARIYVVEGARGKRHAGGREGGQKGGGGGGGGTCVVTPTCHTRDTRGAIVRIRSQLAALFGFNSAAGGDGAVGENKSGAAAKSGKERRERLSISAPLQLAASLPSRQKNQLKSQSTNLESIHPFSLSQGYSGEAFLIHNPRRVFGARRAEKWRHPFLHSLYHVLKSAEVLLTKKKWGV